MSCSKLHANLPSNFDKLPIKAAAVYLAVEVALLQVLV
jgi:hypothetical protein